MVYEYLQQDPSYNDMGRSAELKWSDPLVTKKILSQGSHTLYFLDFVDGYNLTNVLLSDDVQVTIDILLS